MLRTSAGKTFFKIAKKLNENVLYKAKLVYTKHFLAEYYLFA